VCHWICRVLACASVARRQSCSPPHRAHGEHWHYFEQSIIGPHPNPLPAGEGTNNSTSSFILHPSSFIPHPFSTNLSGKNWWREVKRRKKARRTTLCATGSASVFSCSHAPPGNASLADRDTMDIEKNAARFFDRPFPTSTHKTTENQESLTPWQSQWHTIPAHFCSATQPGG
jgi:hypothetical protein